MKKFLSLVLALAMAMSLVVVNTSAKEFTDDEDITYDEAVAVISELLFPNIIELPKFLGGYVHIAAALQFFPVIMWITAEIKLKKNGNKIVNKADNKS